MTDEQQASKSNVIMGIGATVAICTVLLALGKLYGDKVDDIGDDVKAIHIQMQVDRAASALLFRSDDDRELSDAEKFGRILARLDALEAAAR